MPAPSEPQFAAGQIVTVFRSRLRPDAGQAYVDRAAEMERLALTMPGLVEFKTFTAPDGERVTLATFDDETTQKAWRERAEHRAAQREGRDRFYASYSLQVCEARRVRTFPATA